MLTHPFDRFPARHTQCLDGLWAFAWCGNDIPLEQADPATAAFDTLLPVPGCFDTPSALAGRRGTGIYHREVTLPVGTAPDARLELRIGGLGLRARCYWDGRPVGQVIDLPYSGIHLQFPAGNGRHHTLDIAVDNRFDPETMPLLHPTYDFYGYGGIYRSLDLHVLPERAFRRLRISTLNLQAPAIALDIAFINVPDGDLGIEIAFDDKSPQTTRVHVAGNRARLECKVPDGRPWSPESPHLHIVSVSMPGDTVRERFGLRTIATRNGRISVNGNPVKLLGYNRHEAHPQFGPALPPQIDIEDLQILRDLGCNFIRGSHYPQNQRFLDLCDQLGFLVWEETLAWGDPAERIANPRFHEKQLAQARLMVDNSFNHPSVILWGFLNEGDSTCETSRPLYTALIEQIRNDDPTRLVTYGSNRAGADLFWDQVDVVSINAYPAWYDTTDPDPRPLANIKARFDKYIAMLSENPALKDKPLIISEIGAGAIPGLRDRLKARWSEDYQADHLATVCRLVVNTPEIAGVALWQFCDIRTPVTHGILARPRGFNNKGTLDEYRRPKLAYDAVKQAFR